MKKRRRLKIALSVIAAALALIWLGNTSLFVSAGDGRRHFLAHRGLAQTFGMEGVEWDTNTAAIIYPPEHDYIENTLPSIQAAFDLGAEVVELDVRVTRDKKLCVFHDYLLDYRTDAQGLVSDYTMDQLRALDVGYGYTADGGKTYPLRGKGIGLMVELNQALETFAGRELLIHVKDEAQDTGAILLGYLREMDADGLKHITVYGDDAPVDYLREAAPELRVMSKKTMMEGLIPYLLIGFTGYVPQSLRNTQLHLPLSYARLLWGWPARFVERMRSVGTRVVLVAGDGGFSEGFDDAGALDEIPQNYNGLIWTNRIDRVAGEG